MNSNNWRLAQVEQPPPMDGGDWRNRLPSDSRQKIVNKIMETLKRHLPFSGQEGLQELKKIAVRFEEKIYGAATSQSDYLRKLSLKFLTMEAKSQNTHPNAMPSNSSGLGGNSQEDPGEVIDAIPEYSSKIEMAGANSVVDGSIPITTSSFVLEEAQSSELDLSLKL